MRRRWFPVLLALAPLFLAACSASAGGGGAPPAQDQKAPAAPVGKALLFTDPAVRQTARYQTFGPKGWESITDAIAYNWILYSLPEGAQRIEIRAPFKGFRSCGEIPPLSFNLTFTGQDGLLMKDFTPKDLKTVGFSRTEFKGNTSGGSIGRDTHAVLFGATGLAEPCVKKWLEPGETITVVTAPGFDSYYVPLSGDQTPWQKKFVLAFYESDIDTARSKYNQATGFRPPAIDWSPLPDVEAFFQKMETIQPTVEN